MVKISIPAEQRINFFVYIIESPSAPDMYHGRFEGDILQKALSLDLIPSAHRIAVSKEAFDAAIKIGLLDEQMKAYKNMVPIIHISAHGSQDGLQLTDKTILNWSDLKQLLLPVNNALSGNLMLCMSSCEGYSACKMAIGKDEALPFFAVIGHKKTPSWSDTAIAYAAFYHLIKKGCYITDAVRGMCEASGDDGFTCITATEARKIFIEAIENITKQQLSGALQQAIAQQNKDNPPSSEATKLEKTVPRY